MSSEVDARITPALHPDNIKLVEGYDDETVPVLGPTVTAFSEAYEGVKSVYAVREKARTNPVWNEANQIIATDDFAQRVFGKVARGFDTVRANLDRGIAALEQELSAPVASKASQGISAEIRAHAKGLDSAARQSFIMNAIERGDHITASAVLGGPSYLSGVDDKMHGVLLRHYHGTHQPHLVKRLKAMNGARDWIERDAGKVFAELEKAVGAKPHQARKLREAKSAAEKAFALSGDS